jgi:MATE family multidrug resistance protein
VARAFLPWCAVIPLLGLPAWQLDGFFLGATQGKALRNAGVASCLLYVATDLALRPAFGNVGVWSAFLTMYAWRAAALGLYLPSLIGKTSTEQHSQT